MTEIHLRDYQREAIDAVFNAWSDGMKRPAIVLPTGAGKTVVFAHLIREFRDWCALPPRPGFSAAGNRVIVLVHRDELADQAIAKIRSVAPGLSVGKVKAETREVKADVLVCSVQTLARGNALLQIRAAEQAHRSGPVGLIITDECHHAAAESYQKVYDAFPDALQLGVTATLARGDGVGLGSVWEEVVYAKSVLWMISKGYLTDVKARAVSIAGLNMAQIKSSRGDYQAGDLGKVLLDNDFGDVVARAYNEHAQDRPGVVFTPTVETAHEAAERLNEIGIRTAVISGETPTDERRGIFDDFRSGKVQVLANCMVLTEGFDAPWASCAVIARPTQSQPLYVQMVGRVLRPWPGKKDALVLNVAGAQGMKLKTLVDLEPGAVVGEMEEDELLSDAVVREAEAAEQKVPAGSIAFELKHRELNLFQASDLAWLRTKAGVLFISCGDTTVFLWPQEDTGLWNVCYAGKQWKTWQRSPHLGLDISSAMAWGEAVAEDFQAFNVSKTATWRRSKASEAQVNFATGIGIEPAGMRKGELSDAISVVIESRRFDRFV